MLLLIFTHVEDPVSPLSVEAEEVLAGLSVSVRPGVLLWARVVLRVQPKELEGEESGILHLLRCLHSQTLSIPLK